VKRLFFVIALAGACHNEPKPMKPAEGELPPLPPASGSVIGYLIDNGGQLKLRDDQLDKLKALDTSLSAKNDSIDTQLRAIERPNEEPAEKDKPPPRHNNAPGKQITTTPDAQRLHAARDANDKEAVEKAFAVLDDDQKPIARRLLDERGVSSPGAKREDKSPSADDGKPVPGLEP
jgi:hypothetical protein